MKGASKGGFGHRVLNLLTALLLAGTGVLVLGFLAIAVRPNLPINPYPPPTPSPLPSATATAQPPTAVPPTVLPTPARPTPTPYRVLAPTPTVTPTWPFTAEVERRAAPTCAGSILAGTVSDQEGAPLGGYAVHIWSNDVETVTYSGTAARLGPSGWEVALSTSGPPLTGTWYVQLHHYDYVQYHPPVSPAIRVDFIADCQQNEVRIRFRQQQDETVSR